MDSQVNDNAVMPEEQNSVTSPVEENNIETTKVSSPQEETIVLESNEANPETVEEADIQQEEQPRKVYETKAEVLERVKEIAHGEEPPQKDEVDYLKTTFYKLHIAEREAKLKEYIDGGGDPEKYQITPDDEEEVFKAEMGIIKERRSQLFKEQEAEK